ncbi:MAG: hypothetical protein MUO76_24845, partial [Anaerolineaceae bacterium]|nr:hypothetical protein [Anaerolineaceae bacterium]
AFTEGQEEAEEEPEIVQLSADELAEKTGLYFNAEEAASYRIEEHEGKLAIAFGPGLELDALSRDSFQVAAFPEMKINFSVSDGGKRQMAVGFTESIIYEEVEPASPAGDELQAYTGTYYSPEMDINYFFSFAEDSLTVRLPKYGVVPLKPTFKDGFAMDMSALVGMPYSLDLIFYRGEAGDIAGDIAGFTISSRRAKNQKFLRSKA